MPRKPRNSPNPPGRPRKTATPLALARLRSGEAATAAEAAEGLDVAASTVSHHAAAEELAPPLARPLAKTAPKVAAPTIARGGVELPAWFEPTLRAMLEAFVAPTVASGAPVERLRAYAGHDAEALLVLDDLVAEEGTVELAPLDRVRRLIKRTEARALNAKEARFGTLAGVLDRLYARERLLLGPPPAPPDALQAALDAQDGVVLARIQEHAATPITAAEVRGQNGALSS